MLQRVLRSCALVCALTFLAGIPASGSVPTLPGDTIADVVVGQPGFSTSAQNTPTFSSLNSPAAVVLDTTANPPHLFVADRANNRVLGWTSITALTTNQPANLVIGQPSGTSVGCNTHGINARSLCGPSGLAVDSVGNLYVSDAGNNRLLVFSRPFTSGFSVGQPAFAVIGQGDNFTAGGCNASSSPATPDAWTLCTPDGIAVDGSDNLYVADRGNNRILKYNTPLTTDFMADIVLGQPNATTSLCNASNSVTTPTAQTLCAPTDIALDGSNNLFAADTSNNRVLKYTAPLATHQSATAALGQSSFTTTACATTASALCAPKDLTFDGSGNLWVADFGNNRVLKYPGPVSNGESASLALGQSSLTTNSCNGATESSSTLCGPYGVGLDGSGDAFVADASNNRVLEYPAPISSSGKAAGVVLGQNDFVHNAPNVVNAAALNMLAGAVVDSAGHLYVADTGNNRVLGFTSASSLANNAAAALVIGQSDVQQSGCNTGANRLCRPIGLATDGTGNLWVADSQNNRVLKFPAPFASGMPANESASVILGQPSASGHLCNQSSTPTPPSAATVCNPTGVALDSSGRVFVADANNNRVLIFAASAITGANAVAVLGQGGNFNTASCSVSSTSFCNPQGVATDSTNQLWVADSANNRVLMFPAPVSGSSAATVVLGQGDNMFFNGCNINGASAGTLCGPVSVKRDSGGNVFVADLKNNRSLEYYNPLSTTQDHLADKVFGQADDFTSTGCNFGGTAPSQETLCSPAGVAVDAAGDLFVADSRNSRLLKYLDPTQGAVTLSTTALSFGNEAVGYTTLPKTLTITNPSATTVNFNTPPTITGLNSADFKIKKDTCVGALVSTASCSILVTFTPFALGARSATLTVNDDASPNPQLVKLTGNGTVQVTVTPNPLNFGTVTVGSNSTMTVSVTNNESQSIGITLPPGIGGTNSGDFAYVTAATNACTSTLGANKSCNIGVRFTPKATGSRTATLTITDTPDSNSPHNVTLNGTGG